VILSKKINLGSYNYLRLLYKLNTHGRCLHSDITRQYVRIFKVICNPW